MTDAWRWLGDRAARSACSATGQPAQPARVRDRAGARTRPRSRLPRAAPPGVRRGAGAVRRRRPGRPRRRPAHVVLVARDRGRRDRRGAARPGRPPARPRLVVRRPAGRRPGRRRGRGVGPALVRAACAYAENAGVLRFEATVQAGREPMFTRLGLAAGTPPVVAGAPHVLMRWPVGRIAALAAATKAALGPLLPAG